MTKTTENLFGLLKYAVQTAPRKEAAVREMTRQEFGKLAPVAQRLVLRKAARCEAIDLPALDQLMLRLGQSSGLLTQVIKQGCPASKGKKRRPRCMGKCAASSFIPLLKSAQAKRMLQHLKSAAGAAAPWWHSSSGVDFIRGAVKATPGWAKALAAVLAGAGLGHMAYSGGREWATRYDPGIDPAMKGMGLDRDTMRALREQIAKQTGWASELGALQQGYRNSMAPLYGGIGRAV